MRGGLPLESKGTSELSITKCRLDLPHQPAEKRNTNLWRWKSQVFGLNSKAFCIEGPSLSKGSDNECGWCEKNAI
jgi:hypothetical protein